VTTPREIRVYYTFRDARNKAGYCYLRYPPSTFDNFTHVQLRDASIFFGLKLAALSGMVLMNIRVRISWSLEGQPKDADTDASSAHNAVMVFQMSDMEFRSVAVACKPPAGGGWKYTNELDDIAAELTGSVPGGIIRKSDVSSPIFTTYQGAYFGLDFNQKGGKKWKS